jgi:transcriptional regulator with PAS, ATPase and Fis domain
MPLSMQAKLLRVIENKSVYRIGGTKEISIDIRILAATNKDLVKEVEKGTFRQDLFYRLNVVSLKAPSLAERKEDIPLLSLFFLNKYTLSMNKQVKKISDEVIQNLENYEFPGNVRELENIIERAIVMCEGDIIRETHLPPDFQAHRVKISRARPDEWQTLFEHEKQYIIRVLESTQGNKTKAAEVLGIDRVSLWRKLKKYHLTIDLD